MAPDYHQALLHSVILTVIFTLAVRPSFQEPVSRGFERLAPSDFLHSSENQADIGQTRGGTSSESEPFLEYPGGRSGPGEVAPNNEASRFPSGSGSPWNNAQALRSPQNPMLREQLLTSGLPHQRPSWSHLSLLETDRPVGRVQQPSTAQRSSTPTELRSVLSGTSSQSVGRQRNRDNGTLEERVEASLTRVEDNLEGLVAGFLQLQRSVFNLEQLQELLVLLLEDILKEVGTGPAIYTTVSLSPSLPPPSLSLSLTLMAVPSMLNSLPLLPLLHKLSSLSFLFTFISSFTKLLFRIVEV